MLPAERDLVLGRRDLFLQGQDVLVGLELRVVLDDGEQGAQRRGQHVLGLGLGGDALGTGGHGRGACVGDVGQDLLLELHVALDGVHEVRDQVVPTLELDLDLGERLVDPVSTADETVVDADDEQDDDADDDKQDDQFRHLALHDDSRDSRSDADQISLSRPAGVPPPTCHQRRMVGGEGFEPPTASV